MRQSRGRYPGLVVALRVRMKLAARACRVPRGVILALVSGLVLFGGLPLGVRGTAPDATPTAGATPASPTPAPTPAPAGTTSAATDATPVAGSTPVAGATFVADAPPSADAPVDAFREREDQLALQIGRARVAAGLPPLARSAALDRSAVAHARDMAVQGYMDHDAPDGSTPVSRAASQGYETAGRLGLAGGGSHLRSRRRTGGSPGLVAQRRPASAGRPRPALARAGYRLCARQPVRPLLGG